MTQLLSNNEMSELSRPQKRRWFERPEFAIFLLVLVFAGPVIHHWGEQQGSRYALTAALWDQQTVVIDDYSHLLVRDRAVIDGVTYSDKAPGQPFLAVPFYGMYRLAGGESPAVSYDPEADVGQWWVTLWMTAVPGAILAVLMYRWAREVEERTALLATVTMALGTLLLVYSTILFGHVLAALLAFAMFLLIRRENANWWQLLGAGALGGAAVLVEYPVIVIVAVITIGAAVLHRAKVLAVVAGGIPLAILLGLYHFRLFGDPFTYTYQYTAFSGVREEASGFLASFAGPSLERLAHVLVSPRGLLIATPVVLLGVMGLFPMWKRGRSFDVLIVSFVVAAMLAIPSSWSNSYAGGAGPRYFTPALPFLVAPLAVAWTRWRLLASLAAAVSLVTMIAATLTEPQMATQFEAGLRYWLMLIFRGDVEPTIYGLGLGPAGVWAYFGSIVVVVILLLRITQIRNDNGREARGATG